MIRAILFDIDGVLLNSEAANRQFYRKLIMSFGYPDPDDKLKDYFSLTAWDVIRKVTGETDAAKIRPIWERVSSFPYPENLVTIPKGAKNTVMSLKKQSYRLGLVTGRVRAGLEHFYNIFGCRDCFETAVVFEDYTKPKPDPQPLQIALDRLKLTPAETVYIGDGTTDEGAARNLDMPFIAYNNPVLKADAYITGFTQLIPAIDRIKSGFGQNS